MQTPRLVSIFHFFFWLLSMYIEERQIRYQCLHVLTHVYYCNRMTRSLCSVALARWATNPKLRSPQRTSCTDTYMYISAVALQNSHFMYLTKTTDVVPLNMQIWGVQQNKHLFFNNFTGGLFKLHVTQVGGTSTYYIGRAPVSNCH